MAIHPRSGGWGVWARGAAAQTAGAELRGGELAGAGRSAATGARLGRGLVQKDELGMGSPLGYLGRRFGAGKGVVAGAGRLGRRISPACAVLTSGAG